MFMGNGSGVSRGWSQPQRAACSVAGAGAGHERGRRHRSGGSDADGCGHRPRLESVWHGGHSGATSGTWVRRWTGRASRLPHAASPGCRAQPTPANDPADRGHRNPSAEGAAAPTICRYTRRGFCGRF